MKKLVIITLALFTLSACTSSGVTLKDPQELFTLNDKVFTEEDLMEEILTLDYGQLLIQELEDKVIKDLLETTDYDIEAAFEEEYGQFKSYAETMGMDIEQLITAYGFDDVERFEDQIKRSIIMDHFTSDKLDEDLDNQMKQYEMFGINLYQVETEETAEQMVRYVQSNYEMDAFESEFDLETAQEAIYHNQIQDMPDEQKEKMENLNKDKAFFEEVSEGVYTVYVYSADASKDVAKQVILNDTDYAQTVMIDLIRSNKLKIYHPVLKKNMKVDFEAYIK